MIVLSTIFLSSAEYICRIKGIHSWKINKANITVIPGGKFFTPHATLGYTHLPGQFKVRLADGYSFLVTHSKNTLRVTHHSKTELMQTTKPTIWVLGCSFTHGWSLNDQETYSWMLQERLPSYDIVNFGVSGYGTLHALIQFQEALLKYSPPKVAIIAYASFHDQRNTFLRTRRKSIVGWNHLGSLNQPYAKLRGRHLQIAIDAVEYRPFPFMQYSAFSHFLEQQYNRIEARLYDSVLVTKAIIAEFAIVAKEHDVQLIVAGITSDVATNNMIEYAKSLNILTGDISVDLKIDGNRNLPHDGHPSARANKQYAEKVFDLLDKSRIVQY